MSQPVFDTPYTAEHRVRIDGAVDSFGEPAEVWGPWDEHPVYGWGAPNTIEPKLAGHDREVVDIELYVPPGFPPVGHRDQVRLDGTVYTAEGSTESYDHNPFGWDPGGLVNLRKVKG